MKRLSGHNKLQATPTERGPGIFLLELQRKDDKRTNGEPKSSEHLTPVRWLIDGAQLHSVRPSGQLVPRDAAQVFLEP